MGGNNEAEKGIGSRATENKGTATEPKIPDYLRGIGQPLGPDLRENKKEVTDSKSSPGKLKVVEKNQHGGTYYWLLYNFAVNEYTLKTEHKRLLGGILREILKYGNIYGSESQIILAGHASPSGTYYENKILSLQRAAQVKEWFTQQGIHPDWFASVNTSEVWSVIKGGPRTSTGRDQSRSVSIVLPHMIDKEKSPLFPETLRSQTRGKILNELKGEMNPFSYWVIDNWDYLIKNKYCWEDKQNLNDGLFFIPPDRPLRTVEQAINYLKTLYDKFDRIRYRLKSEVIGHPGYFLVEDPVTTYQQLSRWIFLNQSASGGTFKLDRLAKPDSASIVDLAKVTFADLIDKINKGNRYRETKESIWNRIENYFKEKNLPMPIIKSF